LVDQSSERFVVYEREISTSLKIDRPWLRGHSSQESNSSNSFDSQRAPHLAQNVFISERFSDISRTVFSSPQPRSTLPDPKALEGRFKGLFDICQGLFANVAEYLLEANLANQDMENSIDQGSFGHKGQFSSKTGSRHS